MSSFTLLLFATGALAFTLAQTEQQHPHSAQEEGFGRVHMEISCSTTVGADFDRALALLHNFWYARALARFNEVSKNDPACAMAYWGAAMTYNHLFWDPPSKADGGLGDKFQADNGVLPRQRWQEPNDLRVCFLESSNERSVRFGRELGNIRERVAYSNA